MSMTNTWVYFPAYMLVALALRTTEARPIATREPGLSKEDAKSLVYHILESSKLSKNLVVKDGVSNDDYSEEHKTTGTEKGAIIGGTIAAGIILGITVFVGVLIYKQYLMRKRLCGRFDTAAPPRRKSPELETTRESSAHTSWRHTFNHRISVPDSESVYSQRSFGQVSTAAQVEMISATRLAAPLVPPKAAQVLGVDRSRSPSPLPKTHLPTPRLPTTPVPPNPLPQNPLQQHPPPQHPPPKSPLPPTPEPPADEQRRSSRDLRARSSSNCSMSTLGMELLRDVMQPLAPTKFSPPPDKSAQPRPPPPISKTKKPPPVALNNMKGQKRMPSRRYFVPVFKKNGQLSSPTSPDECAVTEPDTVLRDSTRAGLFSLGENKI
ncbi:hypothetical protein FSARC_6188 [Fusarium sarcochroum]|uniref:Uncharacterized protein n=1 Tax=Fusarium sarcochroum TaxID=1208366 RepID=A0A8H4X8P3_9HYPO|nr:hypothetical protein FSARC_6188 [Fusarium sarcochroum]